MAVARNRQKWQDLTLSMRPQYTMRAKLHYANNDE